MFMEARNPYAAPHTNVTPAERAEDYGEIKIFSASGRMGRIRYIGYSFGLTMLIWIVIGIAAGIGALVDPALLIGVGAIGYIALIVVQFLLSIQRSHDMNVTGWLSLIWLVPLGVLVFWFAPGSRGANDYGRPPPPNGAGVIIDGRQREELRRCDRNRAALPAVGLSSVVARALCPSQSAVYDPGVASRGRLSQCRVDIPFAG
jgi:uncharacterized membrane protein YhaH (DUF805 family)